MIHHPSVRSILSKNGEIIASEPFGVIEDPVFRSKIKEVLDHFTAMTRSSNVTLAVSFDIGGSQIFDHATLEFKP